MRYFFRSTVPKNLEKTNFSTYLKHPQGTGNFRLSKFDQQLPPIHHLNDQRTESHI